MINARNYMMVVELFSATKVEDEFGYFTTSFISQGNYPAQVKVASGTKALNYQRLGIAHAVTIEMRAVDFDIAQIKWLGKEVIVSSIVDIDNKGKFIEVLGDYKIDINAPTVTTTVSPTTTQSVTTTAAPQ